MTDRRRLVVVLTMIFKVRGGIPRFNQMLCRALDDLAPSLGLEVDVVSLLDGPEDYAAAGSPWRHLRFVPSPGQAALVVRTTLLCARRRPDALLVGFIGMAPVGVLASPFVKRGFGIVAHGTEAWDIPRATRRVSAKRARYAFVVSRNTGERLCRATGLPSERVRFLPNTLESAFEDVAATPRLEFLVVARLWADEGRKGVDHTIDAFARLAPDHPEWTLRIVGKGTDKPRLVDIAAKTGLGNRIVFEEDLDDAVLAERYASCAVFVLPSGQEGFGIVFLEAMRLEKPCIGGNEGGTPEVIVDGETGLLVPWGDPHALEAAMRRLASDPVLRARMGEAGRRRVVEEFSFPGFRRRLDGYLREWLAIPRSRDGGGN